jgi:hypothetical protein
VYCIVRQIHVFQVEKQVLRFSKSVHFDGDDGLIASVPRIASVRYTFPPDNSDREHAKRFITNALGTQSVGLFPASSSPAVGPQLMNI